MRQQPLPLLYREALRQGDFILDAGNEAAVALLAQWPHWPTPLLLLLGPQGAGKSHLAAIFTAYAGEAGLIIDPLEQARDQPDLFHRLNAATTGQSAGLLILARDDPAHWPNLLPDVRTRLALATRARIDPPSDALAPALLRKRFKDVGIAAAPAVIDYLAPRIARDYAAIHALVASLESAALQARREVTVPLARSVLLDLQQKRHNSSI